MEGRAEEATIRIGGGSGVSIISLAEKQEQRDKVYWDRQARALGFKDYAALEEAQMAEFDAAWSELERNCNHPDKREDIGVCERCAENFGL